MRKSGNPQVVLQVNWIHPSDVERWLRRMVVGSSLNVCSGMSMVGDVRLDTDPSTSRTAPGDLFDLNIPSLAFDTVICDPPYAYYNRFDWISPLAQIARKRFIISPDRTIIRLKREDWRTSLYAMQLTQSAMYLRLYYVFDRKNDELAAPAPKAK